MVERVVVITGASAGLGRAIAREFGKTGAKIGLIARNEPALIAAAKEIEEYGGKGLPLPLDISDFNAVEEAAQRVEDELGPIDIWVNNAMVSVFSPVKEMQAEEYRRVTEVTYLGYVHGTLAVLKRMLERDSGVIVQVGSALAYRSIPLQSAYCASKHAIKGFSESLRCELIHDKSNVKISLVNMPALNTTQFDWVKSRLPNKPQPVPPIYQPEVGARAVVWAAEHCPREIEVGYPTLEATIGEKFIPGLLDYYLAETCYKDQQTDEPVNGNEKNNLWEPVPGDHGAHGRFNSRSKNHSLELWLSTNKKLLSLGILAIGAATALLMNHKNNRN